MSYFDTIHSSSADAEQLERIYQNALRSGESGAFTEAINASYGDQPDNVLYAAWYYRLAHAAGRAKSRVIAWSWVIPLALINGLLFWLLSDEEQFMISLGDHDFIPLLILIWAPISALFVMLYLVLAAGGAWKRVLAIVAGLAIVSTYVLLAYSQSSLQVFQEQYLNLMILHLPLTAWTGVGLYLLLGRSDAENRFAFLIKSLEAIIVAGLFVIAGAIFTAITFGLFQALNIEPPNVVMRLFIAGGGGLIPVLAVAVIYDPVVEPKAQPFDEGLSKLIALLMRVLLPLSLLVLVVYLGFIPFNFREPFTNRDVLIIYNVMLFAVMALLVGATPVQVGDLSLQQQTWLRRGIMAVTTLAIIVGIYALIAIGYRTWQGILTPNRLTFIGWNIINLGILSLLIVRQAKGGRPQWLPRLHSTFAAGAVAYASWTLIVILTVPWLFAFGQSHLENVPAEIERHLSAGAYPILLKCTYSPHIYLLEHGEKRWVKDIATFEGEGFEWEDVTFVPCDAIQRLPDGPPIPPNAGEPPAP